MTPSYLSGENRLLMLTAGGAGNDEAIRELLQTELNWGRVCSLAVRERATSLLWKRLSAVGSEPVPAEVRAHLGRVAMVAEFKQSFLQQRFTEAVDLLAEAGIGVVLLKGGALVQTVYRSFSERPMSDVDLLLEPDQAVSAQRLLLDAGWKEYVRYPDGDGPDNATRYAEHHHLPPLIDARGTDIGLELHTELFPHGHPFPLSAETIREAAVRVESGGRTLRVPNPLHQLLHLCLHFAWSHGLQSHSWRTFRDLEAIVSNGPVDWPAFVALARENRGTTSCYWTLRLARTLARVAVPPEVIELLRPPLSRGVLDRLERHFTCEILPSQATCPSVRIRRAMWEWGMQPGWSGHGEVRPWDLEPGHAEAEHLSGAGGFNQKMLRQVRALRGWRHYLGMLLRSRTVSPS